MEDEKIKKLVRGYLAKGYSSDVVKSSFIKAGYNRKLIDNLFKEYKLKPRFNMHLVYISLAVIIPVLALLIFFSLDNVTDCKADMGCFIQSANQCQSVNGYFMLEGNKILLEAKDCILTKKIVEFDKDEPVELIILLENKGMRCSYEKNNLDSDFFTLIGGVEKCQGELKDILINIRLAQIEIE